MPIVNGSFVPDTLGDPKQAQQSVFGSYSKRDMVDYSSAAYNYLMKQQEQAFNLELWKLQNEYNTPLAQMQRFQDAGLNPNLIYGQQNMASAPASASATSFRSAGIMSKGMQTGLNAIGQVMNTVKAAVDTYDYWKYGSSTHAAEKESAWFRRGLLASQGSVQNMEKEWLEFMMGKTPDEMKSFYEGTPRYELWKTQKEAKAAQIDQIRQIIAASVSGQARTDALKALDDYRLQIMQGQNDAVLNIHTGLGDSFDGFLKAMVYLAMSKL